MSAGSKWGIRDKTTKPGGFRGETASILNAILRNGKESEQNQQVALDGADQNVATLAIGNIYDIVYSPNVCNEDFNLRLPGFLDTQLLNDQAPNAKVYSRLIVAEDSDCIRGISSKANHLGVLNDRQVEEALTQFLPDGGIPSALDAAKHGSGSGS